MPYSDTPTDLFASWAEAAGTITVPLASISELSTAEADGASGSSKAISYALCAEIEAWYAALATADKPTKMVVTKSGPSTTSGVTKTTFVLTFTMETLGLEVEAE